MPPPAKRPQLITYPDSLGGSLGTLAEILAGGLSQLFTGGVHVLPPFPSSADRGFAPTRYDMVDARLGKWSDLRTIGRLGPMTLDVMVNHLSRQSVEFLEFAQHGRASQHADLFMRPDKIWPQGEVPAEDLERVFLRKPKHPFLDIAIEETGETERVWATFGSSVDRSDQIDLDWRSPLAAAKFAEWFSGLAGVGATEVRLDAVGYLTKQAGTTCFMVEPDIWEALDHFSELAARHGMTILPEIHAEPAAIAALSERGFLTYDFTLPGLTIHALHTRRSDLLVKHLSQLPATTVTTLDTHDGIPVQPDLRGVLTEKELRELVAVLQSRGANINRILDAEERGIAFDAHQVNITYLEAAGSVDALVVARAIQLFAPGRPQVYYLGLLGGRNDQQAVQRTGEGRAVNRTNLTVQQVEQMLDDEPATRQARLLRLRSSHPAFDSSGPTVEAPSPSTIRMRWAHGNHECCLDVDLEAMMARVTATTSGLSGEADVWTI